MKASTVGKRNQLQPRYINSPASQQKHHRLGRMQEEGGGRRSQAWLGQQQAESQKQIREALCQGPIKRTLRALCMLKQVVISLPLQR